MSKYDFGIVVLLAEMLLGTAAFGSAIETRVCVTNRLFLKGDQGSLKLILVDQAVHHGVATGGREVKGYGDKANCRKAILPGTTCEFMVKNHTCFTPVGYPPECGPGHAFAFATDDMSINGPSGDNPQICDENYKAKKGLDGGGTIVPTLRVTVGDPPDGDGTNEKDGADWIGRRAMRRIVDVEVDIDTTTGLASLRTDARNPTPRVVAPGPCACRAAGKETL